MKKIIILLCVILNVIISIHFSVYAGQWVQDINGKRWCNDDGSYLINCWKWLDDNDDGVAECYCFNQSGYCLIGTKTPDGYYVDLNGAWLVDGNVQRKIISLYVSSNEKTYLNNNIRGIIVGDSYAKLFFDFMPNIPFKSHIFPNPSGTNFPINMEIAKKAFNDNEKYIVLCIGVNDEARNMDLTTFKNIVNEYAKIARDYKKILILHTYMGFLAEIFQNFQYKSYEYDKILRDIVNDPVNNNVVYIDMTECNNSEYYFGDGMHYNRKFYEKLYEKVLNFIDIANGIK